MYWYHGGTSWWGYAGMGLGMLLLCSLLVLGIVVLVRLVGSDRGSQVAFPYERPYEAPSAQAILATRFARGEISETEYRERCAVLRDAA